MDRYFSYMGSEVDLPEINFESLDLGFDGGENFHNAGGKLKKIFRDAGKSIKSEGKKVGKKIESKLPPKLEKFVKKNEGGVLAHKVNKYNPAMMAVRGAIISMLDINLFGIATAFGLMKDASDTGKSKHWDGILQKWWIIGGEKNKLNSNIIRGRGKKDRVGDLLKKFQKGKKKNSFDGSYSNAGGKNAGSIVAGAATLLGTASSVLIAIPETTVTKAAAAWTGVGAGFLGTVSPMMKGFAKDNGATPQELAEIPEAPASSTPFPPPPTIADIKKAAEEDDKIMGIPQTGFWIGVGLIAVLVIGGIAMHKKK